MKKVMTILLTIVVMCGVANADIIAQTGFEASEGFTLLSVKSGINVTDSSGDYWGGGKADYNYCGVWEGMEHSGTQAAVFGNTNTKEQFVLADPAGAEGVGTVDFWWSSFTASTVGGLDIQWSTDGTTWTNAETIILDNVVLDWKQVTVSINQPGDVKIRWFLPTTTTGGIGLDDVTLTSVPEPTTLVLLGLGGLLLKKRN